MEKNPSAPGSHLPRGQPGSSMEPGTGKTDRAETLSVLWKEKSEENLICGQNYCPSVTHR